MRLGVMKQAAYLSGMTVNNTKMLAYIICGLLASVGGILLMSRLGTGQPNAAIGYEFEAIIACCLGRSIIFWRKRKGDRTALSGTLFVARAGRAGKDFYECELLRAANYQRCGFHRGNME